jgi:hypothetical protein
MANTKLIFCGSQDSETQEHQLKCYANTKNNIYLSIDTGNYYGNSFICLDRSTAIKLHRELKKQISFLTESEVNNG